MSENENMAVVPTMTAVMVRKPKEILAEAANAAQALTHWMKNKLRKVVFNEEQYPEFEDWQLCGKFYNLSSRVTWTRPVEFGGVFGFEAGADIVDLSTGQVVSSAEAMCLNDEEKWSKRTKYEWQYICKDGTKQTEDPGYENIAWEDNPDKPGKKRPKKERVNVGEVAVPLFQLRSMAQTRAQAKGFRNVLSWIFVLAGFKPVIAEEMTGSEFQEGNESAHEKNHPKADIKPAQSTDDKPADKAPKGELFKEATDDVFSTLERELAEFCDGDDDAMQTKLLALTSFPEMKKDGDGKRTKEPTGKIISGMKFVADLRMKNKTAWAGSALKKLRDEVAGER